MRLSALTAAGADAASDLVNTGIWNLLRQRFYAVALEAPVASNREGWTDLPGTAAAEAVEVLLGGWEVSTSEDQGFRAWLAVRGGVHLLVSLDSDGDWRATAAGVDAGAVMAALESVSAAFPVPDLSGDSAISVRFWALGSMGPISYQRRLEVTPWKEAAGNYPGPVRDELGALMAAGPPTSGGKLMLLHGPPGTGKTRVTESLANAWRDWCDVDFVVDADNFFGVAAYMIEALVRGADSERWRLVVIEDSGEFLLEQSKDRPKQGLSRLLNLADGMVGQGLKILLLMTTNEDASELHGAVTRPGRCLANIGFTPFDETEAGAWLETRGSAAGAAGPMTLAELYAST